LPFDLSHSRRTLPLATASAISGYIPIAVREWKSPPSLIVNQELFNNNERTVFLMCVCVCVCVCVY
jgi:hypothetical protein